MVCESLRQSWTVLSWALEDQSPDSWSCRGFSPRCKGLTRLGCYFDWRQWSVVLFSASSVFKVLPIWPFTAWTPHAAKQRKWLLKRSRLLCVLALQPGVFFMYVAQKAELSRLLIICRCRLKCVDSNSVCIRAMRTHQHFLADEWSHSFLLRAQFSEDHKCFVPL